MDWPLLSVEATRFSFEPPFCPWPECPSHSTEWIGWQHYGSFSRKDGSSIPRFRCKSCRRTFSTQTFSHTYYLKRRDLSVPIAAGLQAGSAHRQIARSEGCAPSTVTRRAARLGRHAILLHSLTLENSPPPSEPIVYDDFETFSYSQDFPFALATTTGADSWFVYDLDSAPHPRRGRMTPAQKTRQARMKASGTLPRDETKASFSRWLDRLTRRWPERYLELVSDDAPVYQRALKKHPQRHRFRHTVHPNPKRGPKGSPRSEEALARDAAMFSMDLLHLLVRHSSAHHKRETVAFGRRVNALMERIFLLALWRNFVKQRSERRKTDTPAMSLGIAQAPWSWERVFAKRLFPWRQVLPTEWSTLYWRDLISPGGRRQVPHRLKRAA